MSDYISDLIEDRDNLRAENDRLREALTRILYEERTLGIFAASMPHDMREQARAALAKEAGK